MDCPIIPFQSLSLNLKWSGTNHFSHWHFSFRFWFWLRWHHLVSFYLVSIFDFFDQKYPFLFQFITNFLKNLFSWSGRENGPSNNGFIGRYYLCRSLTVNCSSFWQFRNGYFNKILKTFNYTDNSDYMRPVGYRWGRSETFNSRDQM